MDRYLVTGGTGFLGINFLKLNDINIFLLGHKKKLLKKHQQIFYINPLNKKKIIKFINENQINIIIHAAAITDIDFAEENKQKATDANVNFTKVISDITNQLNLKIIFISTDQLYDSKIASNERSKILTPNHYALTKLNAEKYIKKNNKKFWIIRCSFFGWGTRYKNTLVDFIVNNLKKNKEIEMWDNIYFNPIYVSELIEICLSISNRCPIGIYNVGSLKKISKFNFGIKVAKVLSLNSNLIIKNDYDDHHVKRPKNMIVDINKIIKYYPMNKFKSLHHFKLLKNDYINLKNFFLSF